MQLKTRLSVRDAFGTLKFLTRPVRKDGTVTYQGERYKLQNDGHEGYIVVKSENRYERRFMSSRGGYSTI